MDMKAILQWSIMATLLAATVFNVLYLTGVWTHAAVETGSLLVVLCYLAVILYKRKMTGDAVTDTRADRLRGNATGALAVIWMITIGLTMFWRV